MKTIEEFFFYFAFKIVLSSHLISQLYEILNWSTTSQNLNTHNKYICTNNKVHRI